MKIIIINGHLSLLKNPDQPIKTFKVVSLHYKAQICVGLLTHFYGENGGQNGSFDSKGC